MMRAFALLLLAAVLAPPAAAVGKVSGGPNAKARVEDILYIKCQVCELLARNAWKQVKDLRKASKPSNKMDEAKVIDQMEKITTSWKPEGAWITQVDLVEVDDRLLVKEMGQAGNCNVECKTVQLAAERIMGEHDTDIAEVLFMGKKTRAQFNNWLCYELTQACSSKPFPLPKGRIPGEAFEPKREGDQNMDAMLGGLEDKGLGSNAKLREQLLEKFGQREAEPDSTQSVEAALKAAMAQAEVRESSSSSGRGKGGWEEL